MWLSVVIVLAFKCTCLRGVHSVDAVQMRMMALVALCAEREGTDVTFAEVSKSLQLEGDEAEAWIVRAFGKQLLDGRIDQVRH
jgi:hypothetical protein